MTGRRSAGSDVLNDTDIALIGAPLEAVLPLLAPRRVVLIGPAGPMLERCAHWAMGIPDLPIVRQNSGSGARSGDLLVSERVSLLPPETDLELLAIVPPEEQDAAASVGWMVAGTRPGDPVLVHRGPLPTLDPGLPAYVRRRQEISHELQLLAGGPSAAGVASEQAAIAPGPRQLDTGLSLGPVVIALAVGQDAAALRRTVLSLSRHTTCPARLVLVDDGAAEAELSGLIQDTVALSAADVLHDHTGAGAATTAGATMRPGDRELVVLRAGAEVGARWLEGLVNAADDAARTAQVLATTRWTAHESLPIPVQGRPRILLATDEQDLAAGRGGELADDLARDWDPVSWTGPIDPGTRGLLVSSGIELVHLRRVTHDTLELARLAAELRIPVLITVDDLAVEPDTPLPRADAWITGSRHVRDRGVAASPGSRIELIEPGWSPGERGGVAVAPEPGGPVRILVTGDSHGYGSALAGADRERRLDLHRVADGADLAERAATSRPAFAACLAADARDAQAAAWRLGLPVLTLDGGEGAALVRRHGGGVLLPAGDPAEAVRRICMLADDPDAYARLRERATTHDLRSVTDMADEHSALYRQVVEARRVFVPPPHGRPVHLRRGIVRLLAVVAGERGVHPGSTYVRVVQRYRHPSVSWKLSLFLRYADQAPLRPQADLALVQRTALDPSQTDGFVGALRERGIPLVLELDDHLALKGSGDADYGPHQQSLATLIDAARVVLVSTERLVEALTPLAREVILVPNLLDERLFLSGVVARPEPHSSRGPVQLVYVGSPTHGRDLALLRPVMEELERVHPGRFELNVVGAERPGPGQEWYRRVVVPDPCKPYPEFVRWLRTQRPQWHVALAPLTGDPFNLYKSDLKYLEYAALGLPGIFSDREPYATVAHGQTGLKVGDSVEDWVRAIVALGTDRSLQDELAQAAFGEVVSTRLMRDGADELLRALCGVLADTQGVGARQGRPARHVGL